MKGETVVSVEHLGKMYRLGQIGTGTLSHDLKRWWALARGKEDPYLKVGAENDRTKKSSSDYVWALQDVSFDIKQGDTLGIIGRNGAGKSTLLKLLSRVTTPSAGQIKMKGRVASLLEVGTGFHPELTGRENIYLNGAILGMTKAEISRKFDEIVSFAGIELYVDTPVKRYSSGMYVRLAFAVAAHLEPEILIVDEVLAVGDAEFQKKCLGKMEDIANEDRTIIFVSHNLYSVAELCKKGLVLANGKSIFHGDVHKAIELYQKSNGVTSEIYHKKTTNLVWEGITNRASLNNLNPNQDIDFALAFSGKSHLYDKLTIDFGLYNEKNQMVVHSRSNWVNFNFDVKPNSTSELLYKVCAPHLAPGKYFLTIYICHGYDVILHVDNIDACSINAHNYFGTSQFLDNVHSSTVPRFEIALNKTHTS
jgi:lipopolysaccharide transport system ATP-binding protein